MCHALLLGAILLGLSDGSAAEDRKVQVQQLVRQLNADQLADRDAAEQRLMGFGPEVLELLPPPTPRTPPEVKQRLERIRQAVLRQVAQAASQASLVTLQVTGMPLSRVLRELESQTGNRISLQRLPGEGDAPITAQFQKTPFWQALDEVLDQAGRTAYLFSEEPVIQVRHRPEGQLPRKDRACYQGPFRLEPVRTEAERDLRIPDRQVLRVHFEVAWEPRLSPIVLEVPMKSVLAADDKGRPVSAAMAEAAPEVNITPGEIAKFLTVPLALPARDATRIASLKGSIRAMLQGKKLDFRFDKLDALAATDAKEVQQRQAGATVVLEPIRKNDAAWEIRVRVRFDEAGHAIQSHRNWVLDNEAFLEGPDGKPIAFDGMESVIERPDEIGVMYVFALDGSLAGHRFVYRTPGSILPAELDYDFRDIPLP